MASGRPQIKQEALKMGDSFTQSSKLFSLPPTQSEHNLENMFRRLIFKRI